MKNNILFILSIVLTLFTCQKDDNQNIDENKDVILNGRIKFSSNNNIPQNLKVLSLDGITDIISNTFLELPTSDNGLEFLLDENNSIIFIRKNYVNSIDDMLSSKSTALFLATFNTHFYSLNDNQKNIIINQILEHSKFVEAVSKLDSLPSINLSNQSFKESIYELISEIFSEENLSSIGRLSSFDAPLVDINYNDNSNVVVVKNNTSNHIGYSLKKDDVQINFNLIEGNETTSFTLNDINAIYDIKMMSGTDVATSIFSENDLEEIEAFNADFQDFLYEATQILLQLIVPNLNDACLETIFNSLINGINFAENYGNNNSPTDALNNAFKDIQESLPSMLEGAFECIEVDNGILGDILEILNVITDIINISNFLNETAVSITEYYAYENLVEKCFIYNGTGIAECQDVVTSPAHTPSPTDNATDIAVNGNLSFSEGANTPNNATYRLYYGTTNNPTSYQNLSGTNYTYSGAQENTTYYWKVETISNSGSVLATSPVWNFTTILNTSIPSVTTTAITEITQTTATSGGNVTDEGGSNVTAKGVCWSTSQNPTISDNITNDGTGTGGFISNLTSLTENTTYYVRAYATNNIGTAYGNEEVFTTQNSGSGGVFEGNVTLSTQQEIDDFGIQNYYKITGYLQIGSNVITGNNSITNLNSLTNLSIINNDLRIYYNNSLINLNGLNNISSIGGDINILENDLLNNIDDLSSLSLFNGDINISGNEVLVNIDAFLGLSGSLGSIWLNDNPNLENLNGFINITSINGYLILEGINITDLTGLSNIMTITEHLRLTSLPLENLIGLNNLISIGNGLSLNGLSIINVDELNNLTTIGGSLRIASTLLTNLDGLSGISEIEGDLYIYQCNNLNNLTGLNGVISIIGNCQIEKSDITNLNGLNNINSISGDLVIKTNNNLTDFCGISDLIIDGGLLGGYYISNNSFNPTHQDIIDGNCSQ